MKPPEIRFKGRRYSVGWNGQNCLLWDAELQTGALETFPKTPQGWDAAYAKFTTLEKPSRIKPKTKGAVGGIYRLGVLNGRTLHELASVLGQPTSYSQMPKKQRLIQWQRVSAYGESYHYAFVFEGDICVLLKHQFVQQR